MQSVSLINNNNSQVAYINNNNNSTVVSNSITQIFQKKVSETETTEITQSFSQLSVSNVDTAAAEAKSQAVFAIAKQRLEEPRAINKDEIKEIHDMLWQSDIAKYSAQVKDPNHPVTIFKLLYEAVEAYETHPKKSTNGGVNGSYFLHNSKGEKIMIFKPEDEEQSLFVGLKVGDGAKREHLASVLNEEQIFPIPYTCYVELGGKKGSAQVFHPGCTGLNLLRYDPSSKPLTDQLDKRNLQASLLNDIEKTNLDRHLGNILCPMGGQDSKIPQDTIMIDHGATLPSTSGDPVKIEQLAFPQMMQSWDTTLVKSILKSDQSKKYTTMEKFGIPSPTIERTRRLGIFLKEALTISSNNTSEKTDILPYDLGLLFKMNHDRFWTEEGSEEMTEVLKHIIPLKESVSSEGPKPGRAQMIKITRTIRANPKLEKFNLTCLMGGQAAGTDDSFAWEDSILGRAYKKYN